MNRYNGYSFKVFTNDPYNPYSLSSNTVTTLFEDSKGRIWAGTENAGPNVYDKKSERFYRIGNRPNDAGSLSGNRTRNSITETAEGKILIPAEDAGFNVITLPDNFFEKESTPHITRLSLPDNAQVYGIGKDKKGTIWISNLDNKVYRFDPFKNNFTQLNEGKFFNNGYGTEDGGIWISDNFFVWDGTTAIPLFDVSKITPGNLLLNPKRDLWVNFFHEELFFYDVSKWMPGKPIQWGKNLSLTAASRVLYPFLIDHSGILWAGTKGYGLRKYNTVQSKFKQQAPGFSVRYIVPSLNDIYLGAYPYEWCRLNNDSIEKNPFHKFLADHQIDNVIISKTGDYWIRTDDKGLFSYSVANRKLTAYTSVQFNNGEGDKQPMLEDSKGNIWFPGLGGAFTRITATGKIDTFSINNNPAKPMLTKALCTALYEDAKGIFWMGTDEGFAKVDFAGNPASQPKITWYYNNPDNRNSLNYNHVSCFLDDPAEPDKYLWICTKGGGLNRLDKTSGDFFYLTTKDGLPNDVVYGILADDAGNIWGSTNKGIFSLLANTSKDSTHWIFRNFTKANGLQDDEFNTGAYAKLPNGNLAFGGVNGLNIFNPKEILTAGFMPNVFITDILVNNQPILPTDKNGVMQNTIEQSKDITLTYLQDILTLEFSSLDFTAPAQNKYRYQLVGVDKNWVESGTRRTATYLHLPAGKYVFKVQGSNSQGTWSDKVAELKITMLPPWWRSWWAYLFYLLLLGLGIRAYFKFSINRAKLKSQLSFEQREAKRVKELDTIKTQLYTNITHEFRTPLTVILGMAQQVINKPEEHFKNGMDMIIRNGQSLLNLVNEMLDLSKLETGKMQLQLVNGDVINFLRYIVESFHSLAESQQKQLHFLAEMDSLYVAYDPEKTRQIVANLLSNALKFTPEKGNIYISVNESAMLHDEHTATVMIKVKDTGIGIPESQLPYIFDRFYQLDNSLTRKTEGTGIGLALTKELVKLMEGEIIVKSPPTGANKGSEFTVVLPLKKVAVAESAITNTRLKKDVNAQNIKTNATNTIDFADERIRKEKPLILLVEDNADVVAYTASCLPDYRLAVGTDGREGFEIAAEIIPDLIITDVMMPFVDGFELCCQLRNDERTSHIPIIMLTAKAGMASKMEGLQQGADVYLEKPFNREELSLRIKKLLELRQNLQQYYLKKAGLNHYPAPAIVSGEGEMSDPKIEDTFVKKVREAVEEHVTEANFTIEQLCKLVFMSHSQLHRKLDALTGCSPNKFIRIIRLNKAKELLKNPASTIAAIALDCGYNDPGYFARVFKQECGLTPQEWRLKWL
ncbi:hybrid sensor histidine kinase/response regulator transcription factor [Agriterribacter sp.]|uniref:hybrid sensor histidine kinase/response regulator transcription factor n=1 Tax=Agriterribacter sp. TaxID=2821509 RepID=UPI002C9ADBE1|nr:ATP-binding protein [Agriterribacter sp.]HTN07029.1 ATP-binding protein [Agriterribacter sp.]